VVPPGDGYWPQRLALQARRGGQPWATLSTLALRPARTRLQQPPHGQVFALSGPQAVDGLRIERRAGGEWGLAEVRLYGSGMDTTAR
jgi:hypothetical protein